MAAHITVVLAHRSLMFAQALAVVLDAQTGITVVAVTDIAVTADTLDKQHRPTVVLVDSDFADHSGAWLAARLTARRHSYVIMLTEHHEDRVLAAALAAGCLGFVTTNRPTSVLVDAVRAVARGEAIISSRELSRLLTTLRAGYTGVLGSDLTEREIAVLTLLADGVSTKRIGPVLSLSYNTVRNYVQSILRKLDVHTQLEAVSGALREGIINLDHPAAIESGEPG